MPARQINVNPYGDGHSAQRIVELILRQNWQSKTSDLRETNASTKRRVVSSKTIHRDCITGIITQYINYGKSKWLNMIDKNFKGINSLPIHTLIHFRLALILFSVLVYTSAP